MSDNFWCPLPWNHLMFKSKGTVQACCESYNDQFYPSDTIRETANDPVMKQLRLDLLDPDKIPKMCNKCEVREGIQNFSVRINSIFMHKQWTEERARSVTNKDGSVDNFNLEHLDIRWSNLCNYKCRFCQLSSSSLWLEDAKLLGLDTKFVDPKTGVMEYDMDWDDLKTHLPYVRYVKLAGGEPTIMAGTYQLLEELIKIGNTSLFISLVTNATKMNHGKYNLMELLENFCNVKIQLSVEGMGDRHAWARSGKDDWDLIEQNIDKFTEYTSKLVTRKLNFHTGISWMNMFHLADFIDAYPEHEFVFNLVSQPYTMSILKFYKQDIQRCIDMYKKRMEQCGKRANKYWYLKQVKDALDKAILETKEDIDLDEFRREQGILDKSRNQSFKKAYPEWSHYA